MLTERRSNVSKNVPQYIARADAALRDAAGTVLREVNVRRYMAVEGRDEKLGNTSNSDGTSSHGALLGAEAPPTTDDLHTAFVLFRALTPTTQRVEGYSPSPSTCWRAPASPASWFAEVGVRHAGYVWNRPEFVSIELSTEPTVLHGTENFISISFPSAENRVWWVAESALLHPAMSRFSEALFVRRFHLSFLLSLKSGARIVFRLSANRPEPDQFHALTIYIQPHLKQARE